MSNIYGQCIDCGQPLTAGHICPDKLNEIMHKSLYKSSTLVGIGVPVALQKMTKPNQTLVSEVLELLPRELNLDTGKYEQAKEFAEYLVTLIESSLESRYKEVISEREDEVNCGWQAWDKNTGKPTAKLNQKEALVSKVKL